MQSDQAIWNMASDFAIIPTYVDVGGGGVKFNLRLRLWPDGESGDGLSGLSEDNYVDYFETPVIINTFTTYKSFAKSLADAMAVLAKSVEKRYNAQEHADEAAQTASEEDPYGPELGGAS